MGKYTFEADGLHCCIRGSDVGVELLINGNEQCTLRSGKHERIIMRMRHNDTGIDQWDKRDGNMCVPDIQYWDFE